MSARKDKRAGQIVSIGSADNPSQKAPDGSFGTFFKADGSFGLSQLGVEVAGLNGRGGYTMILGSARQGVVTLARSAAAVSGAANTSENSLASVALPVLGANDAVRIQAVFSNNNNANNKTFRVRLNGVAGTVLASQVQTTAVLTVFDILLMNRNAQNSQFALARTIQAAAIAAATATASIDTSASRTLELTAQKATAGDTATLEAYVVELFR